ncbi:hypothetical protein ABZ733_37090 [Streptomyces longwoodensis]|uniref:hypothetical protein n=1 Tax=Streptomyces longwoodensis TaxID=68231 RepID=UPI00340A939E
MEPPRQSFFDARSAFGPAPQSERDEHGLTALRESLAHSRRRFVTVNAAAWSVAVGTPIVVGLASHPSVSGEFKLGTLLFATQCCLLLATSALLDRAQRHAYRKWNEGQNALASSIGWEADYGVSG